MKSPPPPRRPRHEAVDDASFDQLYSYAKDNGTTIITIAHQVTHVSLATTFNEIPLPDASGVCFVGVCVYTRVLHPLRFL